MGLPTASPLQPRCQQPLENHGERVSRNALRVPPCAVAFCVLLAAIFAILSIQPPDGDDFNAYHSACTRGVFGTTWHFYRTWGGRLCAYVWLATLTPNPFSLIKPAALITAGAMLFWSFRLLAQCALPLRAGAAALLVLGFPFAGHVLSWNSSACSYGISTMFAVSSLLLLCRLLQEPSSAGRLLPPFLAAVLLAGCTNELWLAVHGGMAAALLVVRYRTQPRLSSAVAVSYLFTVLLGCAVFLLGGNSQRVAAEHAAMSESAATWLSCARFAAVQAGNTFLIDYVPVLAMALALRLDGRPRWQLPWPVIAGGCLGLLACLFLVRHCNINLQWRMRWIFCVFGLFVMAETNFGEAALARLSQSARQRVRVLLFTLALAWLGANAMRAFVATPVSAGEWLAWRTAAAHGSGVRPNWSFQDDRYRLHYPPNSDQAWSQVQYARSRYWPTNPEPVPPADSNQTLTP